jgi:hypothetical protein
MKTWTFCVGFAVLSRHVHFAVCQQFSTSVEEDNKMLDFVSKS